MSIKSLTSCAVSLPSSLAGVPLLLDSNSPVPGFRLGGPDRIEEAGVAGQAENHIGRNDECKFNRLKSEVRVKWV